MPWSVHACREVAPDCRGEPARLYAVLKDGYPTGCTPSVLSSHAVLVGTGAGCRQRHLEYPKKSSFSGDGQQGRRKRLQKSKRQRKMDFVKPENCNSMTTSFTSVCAHCLSPCHSAQPKRAAPSSQHPPVRYLYTLMKSPLSLLISRLNRPDSFSLCWYDRCSGPLIISLALL